MTVGKRSLMSNEWQPSHRLGLRYALIASVHPFEMMTLAPWGSKNGLR